jgi:hypothetical protein
MSWFPAETFVSWERAIRMISKPEAFLDRLNFCDVRIRIT